MRSFLIFVFTLVCCCAQTLRASSLDNKLLERLYVFSSQNLNFSTALSEDTIIETCKALLPEAQKQKDYVTVFRIYQIMVNSYCLKGDVGVAVDVATQMYDKAREYNFVMGNVLALQALGNTYMYTNRYSQASEVFAEAIQSLSVVDDDMVKMRLYLQQLYIYTRKEPIDLQQFRSTLVSAAELIERLVESEETQNYKFYYLNYLMRANIYSHDLEAAEGTYRRILTVQASPNLMARLRHAISSQYFLALGDFDRALLYQDSTTLLLRQGGYNPSEYIGLLKERANILHKMNRGEDAYITYTQIHELGDSLDVAKYASLMDTIHVNYWVDQLQLESSSRTNRLLTYTIFLAFLALIIIGVTIVVLRRQRRLLEESRRRISEEAEKAANSINSKSMFLSNMSHEIRTPLNGIVGFSQLLATCDDMDDETKKECEQNICLNSDLLLKLVNDVIDLSNLEDNQMSFTYNVYDAVAICRQVLQTIRQAKPEAAKMDLVSTLETLPIRTDRERLQQVLINLVVNATKFTPSDGNIRLTLDIDATKQEAIFAVEDTGCGIPIGNQPGIFNRFEKLNEGAKGTGLGLSISQLIVECVGGRIWIDPSYTTGARFVFSHPLDNKNLI